MRIDAARITSPDQGGMAFVRPSRAGVDVSTPDKALVYSALWACIRAITNTVSICPAHVYLREGEFRRTDDAHPLDYLMRIQPNPEMSASTFWRLMSAHYLLPGNAYAEIERARNGDPIALWPIDPSRVEAKRDDSGALYYSVRNQSGSNTDIPTSDIIHVKGLSYDGVVGLRILSLAAESISMGLAAEGFGAEFYGNGLVLSGIIKAPQGVKFDRSGPGAIEKIKETFGRWLTGKKRGQLNRHGVEVLDQGMEYQSVGTAPEQAQFLESRAFQVREMSRWFGVPLSKLAEYDKAINYNNLENLNIDYVTDAILPLVTQFEQEITRKLLPPETGRYVKFNVRGLLRGDSAARAAYYRELFAVGALSPNDIRRMEDENPVSGGDQRFVPLNIGPLERAGEDVAESAMREVVDQALKRFERKEAKARANLEGHPDRLAEFYSRHSEQVGAEIGEILRAFRATEEVRAAAHLRITAHFARNATAQSMGAITAGDIL